MRLSPGAVVAQPRCRLSTSATRGAGPLLLTDIRRTGRGEPDRRTASRRSSDLPPSAAGTATLRRAPSSDSDGWLVSGAPDDRADPARDQPGLLEMDVVGAVGLRDVRGPWVAPREVVLRRDLRRPERVGESLIDAGVQLARLDDFGRELRTVGGEHDGGHALRPRAAQFAKGRPQPDPLGRRG